LSIKRLHFKLERTHAIVRFVLPCLSAPQIMYRIRVLSFAAVAVIAWPSVADAQRFDVMEATIADVHGAFSSGRLTCHELVQTYLDRIAAYDKTGPSLNAIQTVNPRALAEADSLDAALKVSKGKVTAPLFCVPVLLKDQVETRDMPTSYGSVLFKTFTPKRDATVVEKLHKAGAIILAKTTMGEFASRYLSSAAGVLHNAYDPTRHPSGSSGGSGASVAANFGLVGIGEDTYGSVRGPAAVSSLVGLRPTVPLVSRFGMLPANPTQDTMGPMTRTVTDAAKLLDVMAGYDPKDPITAYDVGQVPATYTSSLKANALKGVRIGVLLMRRDSSANAAAAARNDTSAAAQTDSARARRDSIARRDSVDKVEVAKVAPIFVRAIADLRAQGAVVVDSLKVPTIPGRRVSNDFETEEATDKYLAQHLNAPYKTLKEILLAGGVTPSRARSLMAYINHTTNDGDYGAVMRYRDALRVAVLKLMADNKLDVLMYATYDAPPAIIPGDVLTNARSVDNYGRGDNRTLSPDLAWPAITVPMGFTAEGLPAGLELLGRPFSEAQLLGFAYAYEQATKHRRPPMTTPPLR
jgi:Asp-tRNA(Asn)/Glu-tRNA(Gln) amidotransferase A subunit family amidase